MAKLMVAVGCFANAAKIKTTKVDALNLYASVIHVLKQEC
jgi:hypothetical protein